MSVTILVVDDNPDILANVRDFLELKGWRVETATTAADAWERLAREAVDLLILDIGLPGMDGMTLCRRIRIADKRLPILMLTARDAVDDRVEGLACGADDYVVKPFALRELGARVEALLRRAFGSGVEMLRVGDLEMNLDNFSVRRAGEEIRLNPICLKILRTLMRRSPGIVSREALENEIWQGSAPQSDSLRSNLYLLRQAVDKPFDQPLIRTHPTLGWSISAEGAAPRRVERTDVGSKADLTDAAGGTLGALGTSSGGSRTMGFD